MRKIAKKIISFLSKSELLYRFSKKIIDYHRNENNCEIETNGELDFIKKNKKEFKTIFDVGANIGEWTRLASGIMPEARIYSFEPSRNTFEVLLKENFSNKVSLYNIGLGERNEIKDFFTYINNSTLNSVFSRDIKDDGSKQDARVEKVRFETLNSFCMKNNIDDISFLKIDTEGNELSVLKGAEKYIKEGRIGAIQFEYGGTYIEAKILLKDVFKFFEDKPYNIFKIMRNGLKDCDTYTEDLENFQYANYAAILKNK
ncbi:MAG TPA: FkbM family methyltransferase [Candidatus Paceibacterota bacterium]